MSIIQNLGIFLGIAAGFQNRNKYINTVDIEHHPEWEVEFVVTLKTGILICITGVLRRKQLAYEDLNIKAPRTGCVN